MQLNSSAKNPHGNCHKKASLFICDAFPDLCSNFLQLLNVLGSFSLHSPLQEIKCSDQFPSFLWEMAYFLPIDSSLFLMLVYSL